MVLFCPHGSFLRRSRNGTQAVPYGCADWCPRLRTLCGRSASASIVPTMRNAARPSQSPAVTALPKGEPRSPFRYVFPLRLLFLQWKTLYRASSTAYGGPPSPKGKVLRGSVHPHGLYWGRSPQFCWLVYFSPNVNQKRARPSPK